MSPAPLQFELVTLPFSHGVGRGAEERVAPAAKLWGALNAEIDYDGALVCRRGYHKTSHTLPASTKRIFSTGRELCAITDRYLYALDLDTDQVYERGRIAPCAGSTRTVLRDEFDWRYCDADARNGYLLVAGNRRTEWSVVSVTEMVDVAVHDAATLQCVVPRTTPADPNYKPKVVGFEDRIACLAHEGVASQNLRYFDYDTATPTVPPALAGSLVTNCQFDVNYRTYDADGEANGFYLAYIRQVYDYVDLAYFDATYASIRTQTIGPADDDTYRTVATRYDSATDSLFTLVVKRREFLFQEEVWLYRNVASTLAADWARLLWSGAAGIEGMIETVHTLGLCIDDTAGRVVCAWTSKTEATILSGSASVHRTHSCAVARDNANMSGVRILRNEMLLTNPWMQDDRCYVTCVSDVAMGEGLPRAALAANCTYELDHYGDSEGGPDGGARRYYPAGVHDVGSAAHLYVDGISYGEGAANRVWRIDSDHVAYANHSRSETAHYYSSVSAERLKRSIDVVELDYSFVPEVSVIQEGCAYISGSYATWYDGTSVAEAHSATPPFFTGNHSGVNSGSGVLEDGTYNYAVMWLGRDDAGVIHRNIVFAGLDVEVDATGSSEDAAQFAVRTTGWTDRWWDTDLLLCAVYRADADGVFSRTEPTVLWWNTDGADHIEITDWGRFDGENLYTIGGALESVCPEGFRYTTVHNERIWTSGHFKRARGQYSKRFTSGSASELLLMPEFHEAQGFVFPEDQEPRGLAGMDEKVIMFTERAVYALVGLGPDDAGAGSDYSQLALVSSECGCDDPRSIVQFPGGIAFWGGGKIRVLTRALELQTISDDNRWSIEDGYSVFVGADLLADRGQIRWSVTKSGGAPARVFVWDYRRDEWFSWQIKDSAGASLAIRSSVVHGGNHYLSTGADVYRQSAASDFWDAAAGTTWIDWWVRTLWIQPQGLGGWQHVSEIEINGKYVDSHNLTITVYNDFQTSPYSQQLTWTDAQLQALPSWSAAKREQVRFLCKIPDTQAVAVRIAATNAASGTPTGEKLQLYSMGLLLGRYPDLAKLPAAQKGS